MQVQGQCHRKVPRTDELLIKHDAEAVVVDAHAAELFRHRETEQSVLPGGLPHLAGNLVFFFPLRILTGDLPGVELNGKFAELFVVFFKERAFHGETPFGRGRGAGSGQATCNDLTNCSLPLWSHPLTCAYLRPKLCCLRHV